ncbi:hypothetical protein Agub_g14459 [Astrephomene gubernaculifera]|uniref:Uncharacterized protein n=1 Tax=Astrephomene gubernaculifera TaxID=47775 RepID=A0AAD3E3Z2_9CHLO|nr:hypothetical protein Agub_g14459 [Astrephomene gubernaculifera]
MAELSALEELLLGGYDVGSLLAGVQAPSAGQGLGLLGLEAQLPLKTTALPQQTLGWTNATHPEQSALYQEVAQSLAAKLEEHRLQQVQVATALQQLQALQQQQELAQLQQHLSALHQSVPRHPNTFQRSRTTDLECLGRSTCFDVGGTYGSALDFEQRQAFAALQHAANPASQLAGLQRVPGVMGQHSLPVRSFSSEHLVAGQRRSAPHLTPTPVVQAKATQSNTKRPPFRQPSGLGPNGRVNPSRPADSSRRARYAATAKAPSWASEDWHPMKAVIASGAQASGGTGVFLPHLTPAEGKAAAAAVSVSGGKNDPSAPPSASQHLTTHASLKTLACGGAGSNANPPSLPASCQPHMPQQHPLQQHSFLPRSSSLRSAASATGTSEVGGGGLLEAAGGCFRSCSQSPSSPGREGSSPASCSEDSATQDPYSRQTTLELLSRGSTRSELDSHPASTVGYLADTMKVVVEEPEREREDASEECDFASLARELAELMSKQVIADESG